MDLITMEIPIQNKNQTVNNNKTNGNGSAASNKTNQTVNKTTAATANNTSAAKAPKTADTSAMVLWFVMLAIAVGALTTTMYAVKKRG